MSSHTGADGKRVPRRRRSAWNACTSSTRARRGTPPDLAATAVRVRSQRAQPALEPEPIAIARSGAARTPLRRPPCHSRRGDRGTFAGPSGRDHVGPSVDSNQSAERPRSLHTGTTCRAATRSEAKAPRPARRRCRRDRPTRSSTVRPPRSQENGRRPGRRPLETSDRVGERPDFVSEPVDADRRGELRRCPDRRRQLPLRAGRAPRSPRSRAGRSGCERPSAPRREGRILRRVGGFSGRVCAVAVRPRPLS
jgi:hypothetical protein